MCSLRNTIHEGRAESHSDHNATGRAPRRQMLSLPTLLAGGPLASGARPTTPKDASWEPMKVPVGLLGMPPPGFAAPPGLRFPQEISCSGAQVPITVSLSLALPATDYKKLVPSLVTQIQESLQSATKDEVDAAFHVLLPAVEELACDTAGHTVVENLLELGTTTQRLQLALRLRSSAAKLSTDANGCWVMQKALQVLPCEQQAHLFAALAPDIDECIESRHGNFVVQACIENLAPDDVNFVVMAVERNARQTASHKYGCRVIQRLLEHCPGTQVENILEQVVQASLELSRNQYGCHVLRCALEHGRKEDKSIIIQVIGVNMARLSRNRLASMVIEKCIEVASEGEHASFLQAERSILTHAVLYGPAAGTDEKANLDDEAPFEQMLRTRFGRSILRRLVHIVSPEERNMLSRRLS